MDFHWRADATFAILFAFHGNVSKFKASMIINLIALNQINQRTAPPNQISINNLSQIHSRQFAFRFPFLGLLSTRRPSLVKRPTFAKDSQTLVCHY